MLTIHGRVRIVSRGCSAAVEEAAVRTVVSACPPQALVVVPARTEKEAAFAAGWPRLDRELANPPGIGLVRDG